eukprot:jgi/Tetstr1/435936/TSEL_024818.t1
MVAQEVSCRAGVAEGRCRVARAPFRVCPLGAHVDHQGGIVSAMALDFGVSLVFLPSTGTAVSMTSATFAGLVEFDLSAVPPRNEAGGEHGWGVYVCGAALALQQKGYRLHRGLVGHITAPAGLHESGVSSSAAVGVACLLALEDANGLNVTPEENVELDRLIENGYLGLRNGVLDQSAILLSRANHLTVIDCAASTHQHMPMPLAPPGGFKVLLAFSGLTAALTASSGYNGRVEECRRAAQMLAEAAGRPADGAMVLRDITPAEYKAHAADLDEISAHRAAHYFGEQERMAKGKRVWAEGGLHAFGRLMSESGQSSVSNYQVGSEPMVDLQRILSQQPGVYGVRFSGAGTRGACVALVAPEEAEAAVTAAMAAYRGQWPALAASSRACLCDTGDAAGVLDAGLPAP